MNNIGIVYLATSVYKNYFENFLNTVNNFFPNDNKTIIAISDGLTEYDNKSFGNVIVNVKYIEDLPYPIIPMLKLRHVTKYTKGYDFDYIFFFDSDTIFFEMPNDFWDNLKSIMDQNKLIMSRHPHYLYNPNMYFNEVFVIKDSKSCGYIDDESINENKTYVITSFFGGKYNVFEKYDKLVYDMIGKDLGNIRKLPWFVDEAYMNKINIDENFKDNQESIYIDNFITITPYTFGAEINKSSNDIYHNNFTEYPNIFINQKYSVELKDAKKFNEV